MKKFLSILLILTLALSLIACGQKNDLQAEKPHESNSGQESAKRVALICGTLGQSAFVDDGALGFRETAEKYGFDYTIAECVDDAAYEENARALVKDGYDLIVGLSWQSANAIATIASDYPDAAHYALVDSDTGMDNVMDVSFHEEYGAYLVGMLAALTVDGDSHNYGAIHATQSQAGFVKWRYPFMQGVLAVDPEAKFVFNFVNSYSDPGTAKELALQQHELGCMFINAACAGGDAGVFEAAKEKQFFTSGQDMDLTTPDNPYIVSCQIKDTYNAISFVIDTFANEEWNAEDVQLGITQNAIGAVYVTHESDNPRNERLSEDDIAQLKQAAQDLRDGKIDLTCQIEETDYKYPTI